MKYFSFLIFLPLSAWADGYTTGQAARMVIGQDTFTEQNPGLPTTSQYVLGAAAGVAWANNMLFVADSNRIQATPINNRVLLYLNIDDFVIPPTYEIPQGIRCPVCAGNAQTRGADIVLGQPDFASMYPNQTPTTATAINPPAANLLRTPTAVASNGAILAVADTDNNRVLIWNSIPFSNDQPADLVLGQPDMTTVLNVAVNNKQLRGPQGVWIQGNQFFVADTQNHRVLIWNSIPTSNFQPADVVVGEPDFDTAPTQNPTASNTGGTASNLLNPVSVTSDGQRLYVSDLGHNRVLIWNSIPTQNGQAADVVLGQPDFSSGDADNVTLGCVASTTLDSDNNLVYPASCQPFFCAATSTDSAGNPVYPEMCAKTMSFPRFALSDGQRLYVADGGNDRVLIYNSVPTKSSVAADVILGQLDEWTDQVTDSTDTFRPDANITRSSPQTIRTPSSLAWDGQNLYVTDPFDMRLLVFTPAPVSLPITGVTNSASRAVYAIGTVVLGGTITAKDTVTITIDGTSYTYTVQSTDTLSSVVTALVTLIDANGGDPNVFAIANTTADEVVLSAKTPDVAGNSITLAATASASATITATASGADLNGGDTAAEVAPGTLITFAGTNLSDTTAVGKPDLNGYYPTSLGGVEVYMDGIKLPLLYVSPAQINSEVPFEVQDASGSSAYVVVHHADGTSSFTSSVNVPIVLQNPGVFAQPGQDPRPVIAYHTTSNATALIDLGGTVTTGETATITINAISVYTYTVLSSDTLPSIRDNLIALINADPASIVNASAAGQFTRIVISSKVQGPDGNGVSITVADAVATGSTATSPTLVLTALQAATCCASVAGSLITADNPAMAGEIISVYATGIGLIQPEAAASAATTGTVYNGPINNSPTAPVDNAQVGGSTANVINAFLIPNMIGVYEVQLQLNSGIPSNPFTQLFIAQNVFTSNIVTIPVVATQ